MKQAGFRFEASAHHLHDRVKVRVYVRVPDDGEGEAKGTGMTRWTYCGGLALTRASWDQFQRAMAGNASVQVVEQAFVPAPASGWALKKAGLTGPGGGDEHGGKGLPVQFAGRAVSPLWTKFQRQVRRRR